MGEYWGARVTSIPAGAAAHVRTRYTAARQEFDYTKSPGSSGADDIETINRKIMNQHPEDISLLADRWQNAHDLLVSIRAQLLLQGSILEQKWRKSLARDLFLEKGPGQTLAYLDDWIEATNSNKEALRALVPIAESSRKRMSEIWADYQRDIAAARDLSTWDEIQEDLQIWQGWRMNVSRATGMLGISRDTSDAKEQAAREAVNAVHERYNRIAQDHASKVAARYAETFTKVGGGHGALFEPMNVVFNPPHPPFPALPGSPPGAPAVPQQLHPVPPHVAPPAPPPVPMLFTADASVSIPPTPHPQGAPVPPALPAMPAPPAAPAPPVLPAAGPVPGGPAVRAPAAPGAPAPRTAPAAPPNAARPAVHNGVLRASNPPAAPPSLPPGMPQSPGNLGRKPAAPPGMPQSPGNPGGRPAAPGDDDSTRRPATVRPVTSENDFASPPPPSSPVLGNPRQGPPGTARGGPPPLTGPRRTGPPPPGLPADTVPPVLRAPSTAPTAPPQRPPARREGPGLPAAPGSDWTGAGAARGRASDPLLARPGPSASRAASGLEEVPEGLRRRGHATSPLTGPGQVRPGAAAELAPRRAVPDEPALAEVPPDEEAFHVETPGGGVIGKQPEQATYRPEPPPLLGRG